MVQAATGSGLEYYVVDVFTSVPYAGNPLALVLGADHLTTEQMQQMALEFHLSETAFPIAPTDDERARGVAYRLRIFTPEVELPFAGHPSVGTAWVMARLGRVPVGTVVQACGAGELPLTVAPDGGPVELTATEFELLEFLCRRPGRVFPREQLLSEVWGYAAAAGTRTVDVHVAQLRAKLGDASPIRTVRGVGYSADV